MGEPASAAISKHGFLHSAIWLAVCVVGAAVLLFPIAAGKSGSGSPWGLMAAGAICFLSSLGSEAVACVLAGPGSALASLAVGMGARMLPPLAVCGLLAIQGQSGLQHLAFVCYLLALYLVTLAVDTLLAVKRLADQRTSPKSSLS